MKFYGYVPTKEGKEPLGTEGRTMFELETVPGAIRKMRRYASTVKSPKLSAPSFKLFSYTNFYDESTYKQII